MTDQSTYYTGGLFFLWILDCFFFGWTDITTTTPFPLLCFFGFFMFDLGGNVYPSRKRFFFVVVGVYACGVFFPFLAFIFSAHRYSLNFDPHPRWHGLSTGVRLLLLTSYFLSSFDKGFLGVLFSSMFSNCALTYFFYSHCTLLSNRNKKRNFLIISCIIFIIIIFSMTANEQFTKFSFVLFLLFFKIYPFFIPSRSRLTARHL